MNPAIDCWCEYVDVGIGEMLANPHPECPVHTDAVLEVMTIRRHESERALGLTPSASGYAPNCLCGCRAVAS